MRSFKNFWKRWKVVAEKLGNLQGRFLLSVFYYLVLSPFALVVVVFLDPLGLKRAQSPGWLPMPHGQEEEWLQARRQS